MALLKTIMPVVVAVLVVTSLAGGTYIGYQRGYAESAQATDPDLEEMVSEIQTLMETNANITAENDALRKAVPEIAGKTVKIGYIASTTTSMEASKPFLEEVILPDINEYAAMLGSNVTFEFVMMDATGQAQVHLEHVQKLRSQGVDIFIGAEWSSMACAALSYVRANKMLMISPSSTSPTLAIEDDPFFRMCPADTSLPPALADVIWSYGVREVILIQRGDSWGDGIDNLFTPLFTAKGGVVQKIRYPAETTDFCPSLQEARTMGEKAIARMGGDTSKVAVLLLSFDESSQILKQVSQCEILFNLTWFGADGTANSERILTDAPLEANKVKLFSILSRAPNSTKYSDVAARYAAATGHDLTIHNGYLYDAAFVLAKSILATGTDDAIRVAQVLPSISESHYGATGWCKLNEYGDRVPAPYDIWYYAPGATAPSVSLIAGVYDSDTGITSWAAK